METNENLTITKIDHGGWFIHVAHSNGGYGMPISGAEYKRLRQHFTASLEEEISGLKMNIGLANTAFRQEKELRESCEKALSEREAELAELRNENEKLTETKIIDKAGIQKGFYDMFFGAVRENGVVHSDQIWNYFAPLIQPKESEISELKIQIAGMVEENKILHKYMTEFYNDLEYRIGDKVKACLNEIKALSTHTKEVKG